VLTDAHTDTLAMHRLLLAWVTTLKEKNEEIMEGKIYSPVGKFAERAKLMGSTNSFPQWHI